MHRTDSHFPRDPERRLLITGGTSGLMLFAGTGMARASESGGEVSATEDMMREHGVLRRALLVYAETAGRLRAEPEKVDPKPLHETALLFRAFGEDYHERRLEEAHVFPDVRKAGGPAAALVDALLVQHDRGRQITRYILDATANGAIGANRAVMLADAMDAMGLMYRNHTAREDTVLFPAWRQALPGRQFQEMGEKFEELERQIFGHDGFDAAVRMMAAIEQALGYADLAQFTAPPPTRA